jgi:hypothetical protein
MILLGLSGSESPFKSGHPPHVALINWQHLGAILVVPTGHGFHRASWLGWSHLL